MEHDAIDAASSQSEPPSGRQFELRAGALRAVITEVGAGLRSFAVGDVEWLDTYGPDQMASSGRGQTLLPWPGRIEDGQYTFGDTHFQLPINEVSRHNAIHGLTRWLNWSPALVEADRTILGLTLHPQPGYPFVLSLEERYTLTQHELEVRTTARNIGATPLPVGVGHHPYFTVGTDVVDDAILSIPADSYFQTNDRSIPLPPPVSVEGSPFDFREPHPIGSRVMDVGYTDLRRENGWTHVRLSGPTGHPLITVALDAAHGFLQVYTGDDLPDPARRRRGIAIEPYTCAANAFNNGLGLRLLQPGESFASEWRIIVDEEGKQAR
jgi:aldose 1-epimerase